MQDLLLDIIHNTACLNSCEKPELRHYVPVVRGLFLLGKFCFVLAKAFYMILHYKNICL